MQHVAAMHKRVDREKQIRLIQFEKECRATIKDFNFQPGSLVLVRNSEVEMSLDKKMKP
jgi:hypothetical protein